MSQANIPNITPTISITRDDAVNLLLASIALEELGLSHIINAEGEKIQFALGTLPGITGPGATLSDVLLVNDRVRSTIRDLTKKEFLLQTKLQSILSTPISVGPTGPSGGPTGATGVTGPTGPTAGVLDVFVAIDPLPQGNLAGTPVAFPVTILPDGIDITRIDVDTFSLNTVGTYQVTINLPTIGGNTSNAAVVVAGVTVAVFAPIAAPPSTFVGTIGFPVVAVSTLEIQAVGSISLEIGSGAIIIIQRLA